MPGIAGIITKRASADSGRLLTRMLQSMMHEPFYVSGTVVASELGVHAGWVAHPRSCAAIESAVDKEKDLAVAFAGECFHDTPESVLSRYSRLQEHCVTELNGLFSGLIIDRSRSRAMLFSDRYGVERVYVHESEHGTYFASEAKALLHVFSSTRSFDDEGVAEFLTFGCPLNGRTLFRGIRLLEPGSIWMFEGGTCRKTQYFTASEWERQTVLSADDFQSEFERTFKRALPRYLHGDGQIGISLTGGLDSRMIMACLPALERPPICYTFAGPEGHTLDARIGSRVASECGLEHRLLRIDRDFLSEYGDYVDRTVYVTDGCAGALWTHEIYLNAHARELATVRLTGNFGSEVLRSVSTLKKVGLSRELVAPDFRAAVDAAAADTPDRPQQPVTFAAFREIPWSLFGIMSSAKSQLTFRTPYLDNDLVALTYRAPESVRRSSASAVRLVRDAHPRLGSIPTDRAVVADGGGFGYGLKRLFAEVTFKLDYMHKEAPPSGLLRIPGGFAALDRAGLLGLHKWLPYRLWFQHELATYLRDALTDPATLQIPFLNHRALPKIARDHVNGRRNYVREINAVVTLAAVDRLLIRGTWRTPSVELTPSAPSETSLARRKIVIDQT